MILKRIYNDKLAQASYLIGDERAGVAIVVDPNRDAEQYIAQAADEDLRIEFVTETHIHADYLSGSRELAHATGAKLILSDEGDEHWKYAFAESEGARLVKDGDSFHVGSIRFDVVKTPGHTPEHISFVVTDEAASAEPLGVLSGDFVFVGDVGRPDLLETAAGVKGTMETGARELFRSLHKLERFPAHLLIWPGHGAGSACGKALGGVPVSSLGYERITNWGLKAQNEDSFVREVLSGQPEPPLYFAEMKRLNKEGPAILGGLKLPPKRQDGGGISQAMAGGAIVVDLRPRAEFQARHIPGTVNLPQTGGFITWAGSVLPYDRDLLLIAPNEAAAEKAVQELSLIGLDRVVGWFGLEALEQAGATIQTESVQAAEIPADAVPVDVRKRDEFEAGHIPGAIHLPLATLRKRAHSELPRDKPLYVYCYTGPRSGVAVSALESLGFKHVVFVSDGYKGYAASKGLSVVAH